MLKLLEYLQQIINLMESVNKMDRANFEVKSIKKTQNSSGLESTVKMKIESVHKRAKN